MTIKSIKKILPLAAGFGFLSTAANALAQAAPPAVTGIKINLGNVGASTGLATGSDVSLIIGNILKIIIFVSLIAVLFMLIFGAFQWIISGGDKEKVASARGMITHSLIGLFILAISLVIVTVVARIIGINDIFSFTIPTLSTPL